MSHNEFSLSCKHISAETVQLLSVLPPLFLTNPFLEGHKQVKDGKPYLVVSALLRY